MTLLNFYDRKKKISSAYIKFWKSHGYQLTCTYHICIVLLRTLPKVLSSSSFYRWGNLPIEKKVWAMPWFLLDSASCSLILTPHLETYFTLSIRMRSAVPLPKNHSHLQNQFRQIWMEASVVADEKRGLMVYLTPYQSLHEHSHTRTRTHASTVLFWSGSSANTQIPGLTLKPLRKQLSFWGLWECFFLVPLVPHRSFFSVLWVCYPSFPSYPNFATFSNQPHQVLGLSQN